MRQTMMERWIEEAEARRVSQIAQEEWAQPPAPMPLRQSLMARLRSMVLNPDLTSPAGSHHPTRSAA